MDTKSFMCKDHHFDEESNDSKSLPVCCFNCGTNIEEQLKGLMDHLKPSIGEEVENVLNREILPLLQKIALTSNSRAYSSVPPQAEPSSSKSLLYLKFKGSIPDELFETTKIEEEGGWLEVELVDESGKRVEGPESGVIIKIDALNGNFNVEDKVDWTDEDYNNNIAIPREDKGALLKGKTEVLMTKGAANVSHLAFTDNSSNRTNKTLRLGARVVKGLTPGRVVKAVSEAFRVKSSRLKRERKHRNPSLTDDIWRLVNISKDGVSCKNANLAGIFSVQDLLRFYHTYPNEAQGVLKVPDAKWNDIVKNAEACNLTNDHVPYLDEASGDFIVLDCAFNILSITFWGQVSHQFKYEDLDDSQKEQANKLRRYAYALQSKVPVSSIRGLVQLPIPPSPPRSADFVVEDPNNQYLDVRDGEYQVDNLMMENATGYTATSMPNSISHGLEDLDLVIDDWIEFPQPEEIEAQQLEEWGKITG